MRAVAIGNIAEERAKERGDNETYEYETRTERVPAEGVFDKEGEGTVERCERGGLSEATEEGDEHARDEKEADHGWEAVDEFWG